MNGNNFMAVTAGTPGAVLAESMAQFQLQFESIVADDDLGKMVEVIRQAGRTVSTDKDGNPIAERVRSTFPLAYTDLVERAYGYTARRVGLYVREVERRMCEHSE